jgi:hypothetical protein
VILAAKEHKERKDKTATKSHFFAILCGKNKFTQPVNACRMVHRACAAR